MSPWNRAGTVRSWCIVAWYSASPRHSRWRAANRPLTPLLLAWAGTVASQFRHLIAPPLTEDRLMTVGDGLVRLRANQIGKQTVFGTAVAATRRVPWKGIVEYDPSRTDQDVDTGSIDPVLPPISG